MRWMAIVLGMGLACVGCKDDKKDEPVEVASDEAKAKTDGEDGDAKEKPDEEAKSDEPGSKDDGETKTAKTDEDDTDEDDKDEDEKDEDDKDEDTEDDGESKTADAKATSTASAKVPFGAGGLSACCSALDTQSKSTSGSNASRLAAASRQCFHLDQLVAQGKTTKGAALSQLKALSGVAPAACN